MMYIHGVRDPNAEHCLFCDAVIPEGIQVCPLCESLLAHPLPNPLSFEQLVVGAYLTDKQKDVKSYYE